MDCIIKVILVLLCLNCTLFAPSFASDVYDRSCFGSCKCCIDKACETGLHRWTNVCIKGCIDGHRGHRCYWLCQYTNCKSCGEKTESKTCTACYDGFYLGTNNDCTLECPSNCKSCTLSTRCTECKEGFYNISTSCHSTCPLNCHTCISEDKCNDCKNGYYNGYEYDNQLNPERDNCTYECRDTCTKCQSYNNCSECVNGKYGLTCQEDCSVGCKNKTCLMDSGNCGCSMNFSGDKCKECADGKYGQYCNQTCPKNCARNICYKTSGYCVVGCLTETFTGNTCSECVNGKYGLTCQDDCSVGCENKHCLMDSGKCNCSMNFSGDKCSGCIGGKYGQYCNQTCPKYCARNICNKKSGYCVYGCLTDAVIGKTGNTCKVGIYGELCDKMCPETYQDSRDKKLHPQCAQNIDSHDDGDMKIPVTATVLGCLLALSVCINFVVVFLLIKNKKNATRRDKTRQPREVFYENVHGSSSVSATRSRQHRSLLETTSSITEAETDTASGMNTTVYEMIRRDDDTDKEHNYQQILDRGDSGAANWIDTN